VSNYFFDTSALAKRYFPEIGSWWVQRITQPSANHVVIICELTPVEFYSILGRRQRDQSLTSLDSAEGLQVDNPLLYP